MEGSLAPLPGADGEGRGRVLILREVGPLQRRLLEHLEDGERRVREHEEMLAHVSRLSTLGEMGAGLAHELNQPLTAIVSYGQAAARLLGEEDPDLGQVRHAVGASVTQAQRAAQIIVRLRQWVRRTPSQARPTDLVQAALSVLTLCRADLERQGVSVITAYADAPLVLADSVQLEQIILNLLRNALEAVHDTPDPIIKLSIAPEAGGWTLSVRDNGPGIAAGVAARLFTPFTTSKAGGLGLGLSLSQTLAQGMGGDLSGMDGAAGGAVFTLSLPRLVLEAASD
ncbi:sensor histidine kinase [Deinococcus alpinitundrae]|uniref:sensor histidine kinase n=1 Tax=Deinococcus alpinitundrae TaxID=468913 RepID=UPI001379C976|nr:ATP-binding protein [Deinococcus alpinitundrae]